MPASTQTTQDPVLRTGVIHVDSLLDGAYALLKEATAAGGREGYIERAAELISAARADLARLAAGTAEDETQQAGAGVPAMIWIGARHRRFACPGCHATVFTRYGTDRYTCNGCGAQYEGVIAA